MPRKNRKNEIKRNKKNKSKKEKKEQRIREEEEKVKITDQSRSTSLISLGKLMQFKGFISRPLMNQETKKCYLFKINFNFTLGKINHVND